MCLVGLLLEVGKIPRVTLVVTESFQSPLYSVSVLVRSVFDELRPMPYRSEVPVDAADHRFATMPQFPRNRELTYGCPPV